MQLDERLGLAASLYEPSMVGADLGTDHAYLPAYLLEHGICRRMLLCEVSPSALRHAEETVKRCGLAGRTRLLLGDGLACVDEPCGCVSVTGMGGETMAGILTAHPEKLQGAVLVLSAHTELPTVRQAVQSIGYHFTAERVCEAAGRMYLVWRAEPGVKEQTETEIRHGSLLWQQDDPALRKYVLKQLRVAQARVDGMRAGGSPDADALAQAEADLAFYQDKL